MQMPRFRSLAREREAGKRNSLGSVRASKARKAVPRIAARFCPAYRNLAIACLHEKEKERERNGNPTVLLHATVRQVARPAKESHTNNWSKELCKPVGGRLSLRAVTARFSVEHTNVRAYERRVRTDRSRFSAPATRKDRRTRDC